MPTARPRAHSRCARSRFAEVDDSESVPIRLCEGRRHEIGRALADHHALEVTNEIHNSIMNLAAMCAEGKKPSLPAEEPALALAGLRKRSMLDVSYAGSPLIDPQSEDAGKRFTEWSRLTGVSSHLIVFGDAPGLDLVIYGCVLILIVAFAPSGIAGLLRKAWRRFTVVKSLRPEQPHG